MPLLPALKYFDFYNGLSKYSLEICEDFKATWKNI